jgi:hypothetical protein
VNLSSFVSHLRSIHCSIKVVHPNQVRNAIQSTNVTVNVTDAVVPQGLAIPQLKSQLHSTTMGNQLQGTPYTSFHTSFTLPSSSLDTAAFDLILDHGKYTVDLLFVDGLPKCA